MGDLGTEHSSVDARGIRPPNFALRAAGAPLVLASVRPAVARLLELTRTTDVFAHAPTVEHALKRLAERP